MRGLLCLVEFDCSLAQLLRLLGRCWRSRRSGSYHEQLSISAAIKKVQYIPTYLEDLSGRFDELVSLRVKRLLALP